MLDCVSFDPTMSAFSSNDTSLAIDMFTVNPHQTSSATMCPSYYSTMQSSSFSKFPVVATDGYMTHQPYPLIYLPNSTLAWQWSQPPPLSQPCASVSVQPQSMTPEAMLPSSYPLGPIDARSPSESPSVFSPQPSADCSIAEPSRSVSPNLKSTDLQAYGFLNGNGTWRCNFPGCTSRAVFTRGCDLRKHHKRHTKSYFCRYPGCDQANNSKGFSSKKDLTRHEAKHCPEIVCEWDGCKRVFSRTDNMRDHVKRIHLKIPKASATRA